LATGFDPATSSSGLHYEPVDIRKLRTFLGSQTIFTKDKYERFLSIGHEPFIFIFIIQGFLKRAL